MVLIHDFNSAIRGWYVSMHSLRNKIAVTVVPYNDTYAPSIAAELFEGVPTDVVVKQRAELLSPGPEEIWSVCAVIDERVVGVCTGVRKRWYGERHRIEMVQVVVDEKYQRLGIARLMMQNIAEHFLSRKVEYVQISVESSNEQAIIAYEKIGFEKFGVLVRGLKHDESYSDEVMMVTGLHRLLGKEYDQKD
jgi:ribosomal protein S18 acetylase RimI-like enzyme